MKLCGLLLASLAVFAHANPFSAHDEYDNMKSKGKGLYNKFKEHTGLQVTDATGRPYSSGEQLVLKLDTKPKAKCMFDMDTFVESNINYASDGGLYAEMIRNRAFQTPADSVFGIGSKADIGSGSFTGWQAAGKSEITLVPDVPLSKALPKSALITCNAKAKAKAGAVNNCGIANYGFFGMPVKKNEAYKASFYIRSDKPKRVAFRIGLFSADLTTSWGVVEQKIELSNKWQKISLRIEPNAQPEGINNVFAIVADSAEVESFQVNLVSLFPNTYQGTVARMDLAEKMLVFKPKAIRWPGGNDLTGATIEARFQWNNTIGPLLKRPGRLGNWQGWNTDGLGVVEMYDFISKIGARLIVGLWAGVDAHGRSVPLDELEPYIQQQVEFAHFLLDTTGKFAELRVQSGGPKEPYDVQAFMIGNEGTDIPDKGYPSYQTRFDRIVRALKKDFADHPHFDEIDLIACSPITVPTGYKYRVDLLNEPLYGTPADFIQRYHAYDRASRTNNTVFYNMEFSVINSGMEADENIFFGAGRLHHSILQGSLAETVSILGMENNCDIVRAAAYAPEFANESHDGTVNSSPGILEFDTMNIIGSTSWEMQTLISQYRIHESIAIENSKVLEDDNIYASAGLDEQGRTIIKLVNYKEVATSISFLARRNASSVECWQVAGNGPLDSNTLQKQEVHTTRCEAELHGDTVSTTLPKWSMTVVAV